MVKVIKVLALDIIEVLRIVATFLGLASLLVVCVALGTVGAYSILLDHTSGMHFFDQIINLKNTGLIEPVRAPLALFNWFVLFAAPIWLIGLRLRIRGIGCLPLAPNRFDPFEFRRSQDSTTETKRAANA